jgi:hypothetical protein
MEDFTDRRRRDRIPGYRRRRYRGLSAMSTISWSSRQARVRSARCSRGEADKSPYDRPQRKLAVGFWKGVEAAFAQRCRCQCRYRESGSCSRSPCGHSAVRSWPCCSKAFPGGEQEPLTDQRLQQRILRGLSRTDPGAARTLPPDCVRACRPQASSASNRKWTSCRVRFPPVMREDYARLPNGTIRARSRRCPSDYGSGAGAGGQFDGVLRSSRW